MDDVLLVYTTWPNPELAELAAQQLILERLAACANILPSGRSIYTWQGQMEKVPETVVFFKTTRAREPQMIERLKALHSYECPCIVSWPLTSGHPPFFDWVRAQTAF